MATHHFTLEANWKGGYAGEGEISVGNLKTAVSIPTSMKGPGKGTNPEEMLLGASATCYLITLGIVLAARKVPVEALSLTSEAEVVMEGPSPRLKKIVHRPRVTLAASATEEQKHTARVATDTAEKACMVSVALRNNVSVTVEPII